MYNVFNRKVWHLYNVWGIIIQLEHIYTLDVECPPLSITNGAVTGGRTCGESVHYQCNIGHNLVGGTSTRHSDDTGTWNSIASTCDGNMTN